MKNKNINISLPLWLFPYFLSAFILSGCGNNEPSYDASGTFEATEIIIPAQANGTLKAFELHEGERLDSGQFVGYIDSTQLHFKKQELQEQIFAMLGKKPNIFAQVAALQASLTHAEHERNRIAQLVKDNAATPKQLDDANALVKNLEKRIAAQQSSLTISSSSLNKATFPLKVQIEAINDQLAKCNIINPVTGTVLVKYAEAHEMAVVGKPLYTIADLSTITLRAYITGNQLPAVKLGQKVDVFSDDSNGGMKKYEGIIRWISDEAEFTPKTIQTKAERANLVYAIKVSVKNDGKLKIGMYGAVKL